MPREKFIGHNLNDDEANKKLNLAAAMYGFKDPAFQDKKEDPSEGYTSERFGDGWEEYPAPTTGLRRRALTIGYHRGMKVLVIIFTTKTSKNVKKTGKAAGVRAYYGDVQPWVKYLDVDVDMWDSLVGTNSTGKWLKTSGVEEKFYYPTHVSDIDEMTEEYLQDLKRPN